MKKTIFILLLFFCLASAFAETGYRGHNWYCNLSDFPKTGQLTNADIGGPINMSYYPVFYEKKVADTKVLIFYGLDFSTKEFKAAGYIINSKKTETIKKLIKNKVNEFKIDFSDMNEYLEDLEEREEAQQEYLLFSDFSLTSVYIDSATTEELKNTEAFPIGKGKTVISIYDYNDDTRCYIYENVVPEKTIVIFIPHEQDF